jgi:hypothetical protein
VKFKVEKGGSLTGLWQNSIANFTCSKIKKRFCEVSLKRQFSKIGNETKSKKVRNQRFWLANLVIVALKKVRKALISQQQTILPMLQTCLLWMGVCKRAFLHHDSWLFHCRTVPLPHCFTVPLPYCFTASLFHCLTASLPLPRCSTASLPHCLNGPLSYCLTAHCSTAQCRIKDKLE